MADRHRDRWQALKVAVLRSLGSHPGLWKWAGYFVGLVGLVIAVAGFHLLLSGSPIIGVVAIILSPIPLVGGFIVATMIQAVEEFKEADAVA